MASKNCGFWVQHKKRTRSSQDILLCLKVRKLSKNAGSNPKLQKQLDGARIDQIWRNLSIKINNEFKRL